MKIENGLGQIISLGLRPLELILYIDLFNGILVQALSSHHISQMRCWPFNKEKDLIKAKVQNEKSHIR